MTIININHNLQTDDSNYKGTKQHVQLQRDDIRLLFCSVCCEHYYIIIPTTITMKAINIQVLVNWIPNRARYLVPSQHQQWQFIMMIMVTIIIIHMIEKKILIRLIYRSDDNNYYDMRRSVDRFIHQIRLYNIAHSQIQTNGKWFTFHDTI